MSSKKKSRAKGTTRGKGKAKTKRATRPILWIGGAGLPSGAAGKKLVALGHPLHWEPSGSSAAKAISSLAPVLVVVETEKLDRVHRTLMSHLAELKTKIDFVVFQLRRSPVRGLGASR